MRNKIIDEVISEVIDTIDQPQEFKNALKQYIRNKFDGNASDNDLKTVLSMIEDTEAIMQ